MLLPTFGISVTRGGGGKALLVVDCAAPFWHRFDIHRIEDLGNAVLGAELEAIQLAGPRVSGSLAFAARDGIIFSSGLITGKVAIRGPLSLDAVTIGLALKHGPGTRYWLSEVTDGDVGIVLPGDEHDVIFADGSLYVAASLTAKRLMEVAKQAGLALDPEMLARTGLHPRPIPAGDLEWLRSRFVRIHEATAAGEPNQIALGYALLNTVLAHYSQVPRSDGRVHPRGRARIVHRAREYIRENLTAPISMDELAQVAETSRRTLHRAFLEVLGDTPQRFVRRLRLHRIRRELVSGAGVGRTIGAVARSWGAGTDLGRLAARYQQLFGERPSTTLADRHRRSRSEIWL